MQIRKRFILPVIAGLILCLLSPVFACAANMQGIDVSAYQGSINWDTVAAQGIDFALIRASSGSKNDGKFVTNATGCYAAGIYTGAYHYAYFTDTASAKAEAQVFVNQLNKVKINYPVALDLEENHAGSKAALTECAVVFLEFVKSAGYEVMIYSDKSFFLNDLDTAQLTGYNWWIAEYASSLTGIEASVWQYSDTGSVPGISGNVDRDEAFVDLSVNATASPTPAATPAAVAGDRTVRAIQTALNARYQTGLSVDGIYGPRTKKAIVAGLQTELNAQLKKAVAVDGVFGSRTRAAMVNARYGARGNLIYVIQAMLYCKGYDPGGIDGIFGVRTKAAVTAFQSANGLYVDGVVGKNTAGALFG